jgi:enamidase
MLRTMGLMTALGGISGVEAVCLATGNTARAHGLESGVIRSGAPADVLLMGRVTGSSGADALDALGLGEVPGISTVLVDGQVLVGPRSQQTPPPERLAVIQSAARQSR